MGRKDLERLVGNLRSMYLVVPGEVDHLFHIQRALTEGGVEWTYLSPVFHRDIADWWALALQAAARTMQMDKTVRCKPTHLGFCDASGHGAGEFWLDPSQTSHNLVWRHPWLPDIITDLFSSKNIQGTITKYGLEPAALILHKATLL